MKPLDDFKEEEKKWYHHWIVYYLPVTLFICAAVAYQLHWKGAIGLFILALSASFIRSCIFFFSGPRKNVEWMYFISRQILTVAIVMHFIFQPNHNVFTFFILAVAFFAASVIIKFTAKKKPKEDVSEDTDDY